MGVRKRVALVAGAAARACLLAKPCRPSWNQVGTFPRLFERTTATGTPWAATLLIAGVCCLTINLPFTLLAQGEMWFYAVRPLLSLSSCGRRRLCC